MESNDSIVQDLVNDTKEIETWEATCLVKTSGFGEAREPSDLAEAFANGKEDVATNTPHLDWLLAEMRSRLISDANYDSEQPVRYLTSRTTVTPIRENLLVIVEVDVEVNKESFRAEE